ncbi:MAG: PSD1 and planctomycete cytochrome C domain-containing protein [Pirellulales bacterium]
MRRSALPAVCCLIAVALFSSVDVASGAAAEAAAGAGGEQKFPPDQIEYFEKHVRPILVGKCVECHGPDAQEAGLRLDSRGGVLRGMDGHPAAVAGDPTKSVLINVVKYDGKVQMPPDGKLPPEQLAVLSNWVKMGLPWPEEAAKNAKGEGEKSTEATMWSGTMDERIRKAQTEHWAFRPVKRAARPQVPAEAWNKNPVDQFVAGKLLAAGLAPSPPADKRTLLRRAYYDLIGLPPTIEEVEAFERDTSPDAFAKVVDKLLASPQYGERWARHWLDVARYGDTKGYAFTQERRFPFAYTYRDYVIRAFNEDLPYDQFVREQLAADKLPAQKDNAAMPAMGFLTCGRQFTGVHDTVDDQIDAVTRGFLGLTLACARCHDHKFDPLTQEDYYSLYGVFRSSVPPAELPLLGEPKASPEYDSYKAELAKLTADRDQFTKQQVDLVVDEARSQVTKYFDKLVADRADGGKTSRQYAAGDARPTIVRRWRDYLNASKRRNDPVFAAWNAYENLKDADFAAKSEEVRKKLLAPGDEKKPAAPLNRLVREALEKSPPKSLGDVAKLYGKLLEGVYADWKKLQDPKSRKAGEAAPSKLTDSAAEELRQALFADGTPTVVAAGDWMQLVDRKVRNQIEDRQKKIDGLVVTSPGAPPRAMSLVDNAQLYNPAVFIRGDAARRGKDIPRRNLSVLGGGNDKPFADGSGRLGLADVIADPKNPLTARVMVNRLWQHHFGRGLVDTPSDFGVRTPPPSHPELLDFLAASFVDEGWSVKRMHRLMMLSQAYQQASLPPTVAAGQKSPQMVDPENRLLWRMNRRRLELEPMRDTLLQVAGKLDKTQFGRPVDIWKTPFTGRRTVYGYIDRQDLPGIFGVFDFANPDVTIDERPRTTVPQQALFAMNSPFVQQQAKTLATRKEVTEISDPVGRSQTLYRMIYGRDASAAEAERLARFVNETNALKPAVPTWQYGIADYNLAAGKVKSFTPFRHWTGKYWQTDAKYPDPQNGHAILRNNSGHAGRSPSNTTAIRWTAPQDGVVSLGGSLKHENKEGDGVTAHAVSSRTGKLGEWTAHNGSKPTTLDKVEVRRGDVIDLVVEPGKTGSHDSFVWAPEFKLIEGSTNAAWNYEKDFHGPAAPTMNAWELAAQVLLMSNEFMFVD